MKDNSLGQWLVRLESLHPNSIDLGLERVERVARALDILPISVPVITVAGTNGKGSTAAVLEALLGQAGRTTGVYTSPHLLRFNERIRVSGVEATDQEIVAAFAAIEASRGDTSLTYFEFATLAALLVFRSRSVDVLVLEVGLGGRLDAVNIVDPSVAVITPIALDHQSWLGSDRGSIAREKAGIIRSGVPVVIADPAPPPELLSAARETGAGPVVCLGPDYSCEVSKDGWWGVLRGVDGMPRSVPPQPVGPLKPANICAAAQAALLLGCDFSDAQLGAALAQARPRGRCERHSIAGREYVLDVAHNPAAVYNLVEYLRITHCKGETIALFSAMDDKDISAMIEAASDTFSAWFTADQPANPRAAGGSEIAALLRASGQPRVTISKNLGQAFRRANGMMATGDRVVVFGSFFTVAAVLPLLDLERSRSGA